MLHYSEKRFYLFCNRERDRPPPILIPPVRSKYPNPLQNKRRINPNQSPKPPPRKRHRIYTRTQNPKFPTSSSSPSKIINVYPEFDFPVNSSSSISLPTNIEIISPPTSPRERKIDEEQNRKPPTSPLSSSSIEIVDDFDPEEYDFLVDNFSIPLSTDIEIETKDEDEERHSIDLEGETSGEEDEEEEEDKKEISDSDDESDDDDTSLVEDDGQMHGYISDGWVDPDIYQSGSGEWPGSLTDKMFVVDSQYIADGDGNKYLQFKVFFEETEWEFVFMRSKTNVKKKEKFPC